MNRRSFLGFLVSFPAAVVAAVPEPRQPWTATGILDNRTHATPVSFESIWDAIDEFESEARMSTGLTPWTGIVGQKGT